MYRLLCTWWVCGMIGKTRIHQNPANEQMHDKLWFYPCRCNRHFSLSILYFKKDIEPEYTPWPKRNRLSSQPPFSGSLALSFRECILSCGVRALTNLHYHRGMGMSTYMLTRSTVGASDTVIKNTWLVFLYGGFAQFCVHHPPWN